MSYALRELVEQAPMPPTVWAISVAALIGNVLGGWRLGPKGRPAVRSMLLLVYGVDDDGELECEQDEYWPE